MTGRSRISGRFR